MMGRAPCLCELWMACCSRVIMLRMCLGARCPAQPPLTGCCWLQDLKHLIYYRFNTGPVGKGPGVGEGLDSSHSFASFHIE